MATLEPAVPRVRDPWFSVSAGATREADIARNMAVCHVLGIDPGRTTDLSIDLGPDGSMVARWSGLLFLDADQRAAVAAIIGGR